MNALAIVVDVVSAVLLLVGALLALVAAVGLHRLPTLGARLHAATKPATLGVSCLLLGAAPQVPAWEDRVTLLLAIAVQLSTAPVAGHLLGRANRDALDTDARPRD